MGFLDKRKGSLVCLKMAKVVKMCGASEGLVIAIEAKPALPRGMQSAR